MNDDPSTLEDEHHEPPQRRPAWLVAAGITALFLAGLFFAGWIVLRLRVEPEPLPLDSVPPTEPDTSGSVGGTVELELATYDAVCGDGVCDLAAENSDLCPQDCPCQDDGLTAAGEGCGCRDVLCSGEDAADLCGVPCPQDRCDNGFACADGVCWDAVCGPTPTFTSAGTLTWTPTLTATSTATSTSTVTPTLAPTRTVSPTVAACGNGVCDEGENSDLCASDCQCVDNGVCEAGEGSGCRDCGASAGGCGSPCTDSSQCAEGFACSGGVCWDACTCQGQCGGEVAPDCGACFDGPGIWGPPTTGCIFACNCCEFTPTDACGNPCPTYPACDLTAPYCG